MSLKLSSPRFKKKLLRSFTLIEVVIALAIVSLGLISILGLFTLGLKDLQESQSQTVGSIIAKDAMMRVNQSVPYLQTAKLPPNGYMYSNNFYYTDGGQYLTNNAPPPANAVYLASTVVCGLYATNYPPGIGSKDGQLAALKITIRWPVDANGDLIKTLGNKNRIDYVSLIAKTTDLNWPTPPTPQAGLP